MEEIELVDRTPSTTRGATRYEMVRPEPQTTDLSPRLPQHSTAAIVASILSQPAPVPQRTANTVERTRLNGDGRADPVRSVAAGLIRVAMLAGAGLFLAVPLAIVAYRQGGALLSLLVFFVYALTLLWIVERENARTLRHSQAGVELSRAKDDHNLEMAHEQNRHAETMAAITGDIEIKLRVLDLAAGTRQLADRGGR